MDFCKSQDSPTQVSASPTAGSQQTAPYGPQPTSRWECPARYMTNHKHQDGRPLCQYCECWNPAPFPNGRLPIEPDRLSTVPSLPVAIGVHSPVSSIQVPIGQAAFPTVVSPLYSGYNLPPAPESHLGHISVRDLSPHI